MGDDLIKVCMNENELVDSLFENEDVICMEYNLGRKVSNIKNTGKIAWGLLIGGVAGSVIAIVSSKTLGKGKAILASSIAAAIPSASVAVFYMGLPSTISLIRMMIYAYKNYGGINKSKDIILKLRNDYYISEKNGERVILKKVADEKVKEVKISEIKNLE